MYYNNLKFRKTVTNPFILIWNAFPNNIRIYSFYNNQALKDQNLFWLKKIDGNKFIS